jgi:thymidylate kinase
VKSTIKTKLEMARELFRFFDRNAVQYVVVGDVSRFSQEIPSDIDIVVDSRDMDFIAQRLNEFCQLLDLRIVQVLQHEQTAWCFILTGQNDRSKLLFLHPDICSDYYRHGVLFLKANELLAGCRLSHDGFNVPAPKMAFIYYLLKKIDKGHLDRQQFQYLKGQWLKDPDGAIGEVKRFWSNENGKLIVEAFERNDRDSINSKIDGLKRYLHAGLSFSMRSCLNEQIRKTTRLLYPIGIFVAFLGADGSGKSTVIDQVERNLAPAFRCTKCFHLRSGFGAKRHPGWPVTDPHGKPPRGALTSFAKLGLWWADYVFDYVSDVYLRLIKSTFVIYDRYYYDLLVDPTRYRYGGSMALAKVIGYLVPRPNLVILLDAPAEVLQSRKQEVSLEETARQRTAYLELVQGLPNGYVVDASKPLEQVVADVENIILNFMTERTVWRLGLNEK